VRLSSSPAVTKLKLLFIVVIALFGGMNLGAAVGALMDQRERADVNARLRTAACGFRVLEDGTQLWRFALHPLTEELAPPQGPAVQLSLVLGMPFARLRAAMPDSMFSSDLSAALGRRHGFSAAGLNLCAALHRDLLLHHKEGAAGSKKEQRPSAAQVAAWSSHTVDAETATPAAADVPAAAAHPPTAAYEYVAAAVPSPAPPLHIALHSVAAEEEAHLAKYADNTRTVHEEFVGTALVLAFLQVTQLAPVVEIGAMRSAASKYFGDLTTPGGGRTFHEINTAFLTLLAPGILNTRAGWLNKVRAATSMHTSFACPHARD
jgi:hypothetical protein